MTLANKSDLTTTNPSSKNFSLLDKLIIEFEHLLTTVSAGEKSHRDSPATSIAQESIDPDTKLSNQDKKLAQQFMRINHCGEVCAQALYRSQSWFAKDKATLKMLQQSAKEEQDHLAWCAQRLHQLDGRTSYLDAFFYLGSLVAGSVAAAYGDNISMGFIEETEHQVWYHLQGHVDKLSSSDLKTQAIILQMQQDEAQHAEHARTHGAKQLPVWVRNGMRWTAKCMTATTRWI